MTNGRNPQTAYPQFPKGQAALSFFWFVCFYPRDIACCCARDIWLKICV